MQLKQVLLINGTYGVGKTTVANLIVKSEYQEFIMMDPDEYYCELATKGLLPFIGWPMQASKIFLTYFKNKLDFSLKENNVVIPVTISTEICKTELYDYLKDTTELIHVILFADDEVVIKRINNDIGRSKDFSKENLHNNLLFMKKYFLNANWIDTTTKSVEEVANDIIRLLP